MTPILISLISLTLAAIAFGRTVRSDRRRLLIELHRDFISPESALARAALHELYGRSGPSWFEKTDRRGRAQVDSEMASLNLLAWHVLRGHVSKKDADDLWAARITVCWYKIQEYVEFRESRDHERPWPWLDKYVESRSAATKKLAQQQAERDAPKSSTAPTDAGPN